MLKERKNKYFGNSHRIGIKQKIIIKRIYIYIYKRLNYIYIYIHTHIFKGVSRGEKNLLPLPSALLGEKNLCKHNEVSLDREFLSFLYRKLELLGLFIF